LGWAKLGEWTTTAEHHEIENKGVYLIFKAKYLGQFSCGNPLV
jgi:hypothetical protein